MNDLRVGMEVRKKNGYKYPGIVVAEFEKLNREKRYVVECTADKVEGILHIFRREQLEVVDND